jgi:AbiV family abortive infection protein
MARTLNPELLRSYTDAALDNAAELHAESKLLVVNGHNPRAYFLAIACIEEVGKAMMAFDGQNRKLDNPAVVSKLRKNMEDHSTKITYAFMPMIVASTDQRQAVEVALDLMTNLKRGREPSMYSDLRSDPDRAQRPREVVRETAARDCVRLSGDCLAHGVSHVQEKQPQQITRAMDMFFTMKRSDIQKMLKTEDFWWYYIARRERGDLDWAEALIGYYKEHIQPGTLFKSA